MPRSLVSPFTAALIAALVCAPVLAQDASWSVRTFQTLTVGGSANRIEGSGVVADEARALTGFHALRLSGPIDVVVHQSARDGVKVQADGNLLALVDTVVRDGVLEIALRRGASLHTRHPIVVTVDCKTLDAVFASGSGDIRIDRVQTHAFNLAVSGSNDVEVDALETEILGVSMSGSGDFRAAGHALTQGYSLAGSGDVHAADLVGEQVAVKIAGSGDAQVHATQTLAVSIAGSGDVRYRGHPRVSRAIAGSGEVTALD